MPPFTEITAIAAPLMRRNVDTDVIIRIERLIGLPPQAIGPYAFESWRYRPDGSEDPGFLLNREPYRRARILLNGPNFGCGSSREGAVWALYGMGIRCVIAPSFGDIFFNNCFQNGLLPVVLPEATVRALADWVEQAPEHRPITVSLLDCTVRTTDGSSHRFEVDPLRREALLAGLDDIGLTLRRQEQIAQFQARDRRARAWAYPAD
ncbi:MAG: 3-isopropylmalate dehydratase small subunit [Burkholderiales bacterium]|nr:MAG: 3-isopropylmalate dehydratase small subunit [Burkholderiales bacterium]